MSRTLRTVAALGTAALCVSLAACNNGGGGGNVAAVNGQGISRADFDHKLESSPAAKQVLGQLVQQQLLDQYARDKKVDVSQAEIDKKEDETKARMQPGQFEQILKQQGLTEQTSSRSSSSSSCSRRPSRRRSTSATATSRRTSTRTARSSTSPRRCARATSSSPIAAKAKEVLAKLKAGGSWDALAKQYSTDPSSKDKGGELGFFGRGQMVPAFQDAAFGAKVGQIVGPVKSPFGYHVIQVEEKKPAQHGVARERARQDQDAAHAASSRRRRSRRSSQQLEADAKIDIYDDRYKDLFPPAPGAAASAAPARAAPASAAPASAAPAPAATK